MACPHAKAVDGCTAGLPRRPGKPNGGFENLTAMVTDGGVAALHRQRLSIIDFSGSIHDVGISGGSRTASGNRSEWILEAILGSARHWIGVSVVHAGLALMINFGV